MQVFILFQFSKAPIKCETSFALQWALTGPNNHLTFDLYMLTVEVFNSLKKFYWKILKRNLSLLP